MKKIFIDTGAWIACVDSNDSNHNFAGDYLKEIRKKNFILYSSNYIFDETITWIKYKLGHQKAVKFKKLWDKSRANNRFEVYWVDESIANKALEIFVEYGEHNLSFTDCTSFVICQQQKIKNIFGFDSDFNTLGFLLSPLQIREKRAEYQVLNLTE